MTLEKIKKIREALLPVFSADVYDALDSMGYSDQCLDLKIKPLRDDMKLVGPALTVLGTREPLYGKELGGPASNDFAIFNLIYEGCVIVINGEKDEQTGHWGEMMSYGARNRKATGVVIDGGTRDKQGILNMEDWTCFAKYTTPIEARQRWRFKTFEKPIFMSGTLKRSVRVNPGDWVFGDCDAVIIIPQEILEEALSKILNIFKNESLSRKELSTGGNIEEIVAKYDRM